MFVKHLCPLPQHITTVLILGLDLWPTDLNINRNHLLMNGYLHNKFQASEAKHSWVIHKVKGDMWVIIAQGVGDMTFDLLAWTSIGIIYLSRTIYLQSLKVLGQSVLSHPLHKAKEDWHDFWPWTTDLNINRDHLPIKDYQPIKFKNSGIKHFWVICCTRFRETNLPTDQPANMYKAITKYLHVKDSLILFYMAELQCTNAFVLKSTVRQTDGQTWSKQYIPHNFVHEWNVRCTV